MWRENYDFTTCRIDKSHAIKIDSNIASVEVKYRSMRLGDIPHSQANIEKAKRLLGYVPLVHFVEGLKETINGIIPMVIISC